MSTILLVKRFITSILSAGRKIVGEKYFSAHRKFEKKSFHTENHQISQKRAPLDSIIRIGQQFWQRSYFLLMSQRVEMSTSSSSSTKKVGLQQSTDDEDGQEEKTHRHVPTVGYLAHLRQQKTNCDTKNKYLLITKYGTIGDQRRAYRGPLDPDRLWYDRGVDSDQRYTCEIYPSQRK